MRPLVLSVLFASACSIEPPAAWEPGDAPLTYSTWDDRAAEAFRLGCEQWTMTGLTCERAPIGKGKIRLYVMPTDESSASASTHYEFIVDFDPNWAYSVTFDEAVVNHPVLAHQNGGHEVGHLLGLWEHIEHGPALLTSHVTSQDVTTTDLDALSDVWGVNAMSDLR